MWSVYSASSPNGPIGQRNGPLTLVSWPGFAGHETKVDRSAGWYGSVFLYRGINAALLQVRRSPPDA
jgi:hypothetical protein